MQNIKKSQAAATVGLAAVLALGSFGIAGPAYAVTETEDNTGDQATQVVDEDNYKTYPVNVLAINGDRSGFTTTNTSIAVEKPTFSLGAGFVGGETIWSVLSSEVGPSHRDNTSDSNIKYWYLWDSAEYTTNETGLPKSNELTITSKTNGLYGGDVLYCVPVVYSINLNNTDLAQTEYLYYPGETPELPDLTGTRDGYVFTGWYTDADCTQSYEPAALAKQETYGTQTIEMNLYAGWEEESAATTAYTVKFDDCLESTTDDLVVEVEEGKALTEPNAPTCDGYQFAGWWLCEGSNYVSEWNFNDPVTSDMTLYAKWNEIPGTQDDAADGSDQNANNGSDSNDNQATTTEEKAESLPQTADGTLPLAAGTALLAGAAGLTAFGAYKKRKSL